MSDTIQLAPYGVPLVNYAPYSQDLDLFTTQLGWRYNRVGVNPDFAIAPDGTMTADHFFEFVDTVPASYFLFDVPPASFTAVAGSTWTTSVFFKGDTRTQFAFGYGAAGGQSAFGHNGAAQDMIAVFETIPSKAGQLYATAFPETLPAPLQYIGNGWWRAAVTVTAFQNGLVEPKIQLVVNGSGGYIGNGSGAYAWGLQIEPGSSASSYLPNSGATVPVTTTPYVAPTLGITASSILGLPLQVGVPQTFGIQLSGVVYQLTFLYRNDPGGNPGWFMDVSDANGVALAQGLAVVTGADVLGQLKHLGFGGALVGQTISNPDSLPTFANFGDDFRLFWAAA